MKRLIEKYFGNIYHPIVYKFRTSVFFHKKEIKSLIEKTSLNETRRNRIYVDITDIHSTNIMTGIQRVSHNISKQLSLIDSDFDIVTVYCRDFQGFFDSKTNQKITFIPKDIFFGLDKFIYYAYKYDRFFKFLMKNNIKVGFFVHDLIPVRLPKYCMPRCKKSFNQSIKQVVNYDFIICNSVSTANDLKQWLEENPALERNKNLKISYSLLGTDFKFSKSDKNSWFHKNNHISFLMVSTVEPRKKYDQVIKAFDYLWAKNKNVTLSIVGRKGWKCKKTIRLIEKNKEFGKKLFWYCNGISDEELIKQYKKCDAVIMASIAEGFGLAVAEAAAFNKPLILREIPIFKEIAQENAFYFNSLKPVDLAKKIEEWIDLYKVNQNPSSKNIKFRTWNDCAKDIYKILVE